VCVSDVEWRRPYALVLVWWCTASVVNITLPLYNIQFCPLLDFRCPALYVIAAWFYNLGIWERLTRSYWNLRIDEYLLLYITVEVSTCYLYLYVFVICFEKCMVFRSWCFLTIRACLFCYLLVGVDSFEWC